MNNEKQEHKTERRASSELRVAEGGIAFVEMTKSCARDLTDRIRTAGEQFAVMLYRAHEGRAWAALGYPSWKEYCKVEFQMSKARSYQLLDFIEIKQEIEESTIGGPATDQKFPTGQSWYTPAFNSKADSPQNERQTRALKAVPAGKRAEVWKEAAEAAGGGQASGADVEAKVSQSKQAPEISGELRAGVRRAIAAALNQAWGELHMQPKMNWQIFRSGVQEFLQNNPF